MESKVAAVTKIDKRTEVGANTMDKAGAAVQSALSGAQKHLEAGKMPEAKQAFARASQAFAGVAKGGGADGASRKAMDDLGAAFRSDDVKAATKGVEAAKKAISSGLDNHRMAEKSVTHFKESHAASQSGVDVGGVAAKRMFSALA